MTFPLWCCFTCMFDWSEKCPSKPQEQISISPPWPSENISPVILPKKVPPIYYSQHQGALEIFEKIYWRRQRIPLVQNFESKRDFLPHKKLFQCKLFFAVANLTRRAYMKLLNPCDNCLVENLNFDGSGDDFRWFVDIRFCCKIYSKNQIFLWKFSALLWLSYILFWNTKSDSRDLWPLRH